MGKICVNDSTQFMDMKTVVSLSDNYCTSEPFIKSDYGIRVQKIGSTYRVWKKFSTGSGWKSQFGGSQLIQCELTEEYKLWADKCSKEFGGMDLLAVDALHEKDTNKYHILEMNSSAIGITSGNFIFIYLKNVGKKIQLQFQNWLLIK